MLNDENTTLQEKESGKKLMIICYHNNIYILWFGLFIMKKLLPTLVLTLLPLFGCESKIVEGKVIKKIDCCESSGGAMMIEYNGKQAELHGFFDHDCSGYNVGDTFRAEKNWYSFSLIHSKSED